MCFPLFVCAPKANDYNDYNDYNIKLANDYDYDYDYDYNHYNDYNDYNIKLGKLKNSNSNSNINISISEAFIGGVGKKKYLLTCRVRLHPFTKIPVQND